MFKFNNLLIITLLFFLILTSNNNAFSKDLNKAKGPGLTVYNQNFALVKDYIILNLTNGINELEISDIASLIDPTSVTLKNLSSPESVIIKEQNYRYDLIDKSTILDKMVGKSIKFRKDNETKEGILLNPATANIRNASSYSSRNSGYFAIKTPEGILLTSLGDVIIDKLPDGLYPSPTLAWKVDSNRNGNQNLELAYLTDGINWYADYIATVDKDDKQIDLTAWVTLDNKSGMSYNNASLKLVAGDVRKLKERRYKDQYLYANGAVGASKSFEEPFKEESFFEYHLYTLKDKTDVKNNETKQLTLTKAFNIPVTKKFIYDPLRNSYYNWINQGYYYYRDNRPGSGRDTSKNNKINVILELKNSKSNHLGIPLPKGTVRVYKKDNSGDLQFAGEDQIDHTPEDEKIELYIGDAFDIVGERKAIEYKDLSKAIEVTFEFKIRNHKKQSVEVEIYERVFGDWEITNKSQNYTKKDAHTIVFPVRIAAKGETTVTYTISVKRPD
ncbi:MAG: DUF4139 domain-containing protein [Cyanobacteriota bacterium]